MSTLKNILYNLPEVAAPAQKKVSFKEKLKWTTICLVLFFVLGMIPLFGLGQNALARFEILSIILGASFGSLISLGIGPIVTASIVLQLLNGSGIIGFDLSSTEGRKTFQGIQKLLAVFFVIFEAAVYVFMGGLAPAAELAGTSVFTQLQFMLIAQLFLGGIIIMLMDEVVSKWGFGSGISLFIVAGVAQQVLIRALSFLHPSTNPEAYVGAIPEFFRSLAIGNPQGALLMLAGIVSTILIFGLAVYFQAMKVEIPLSFGRIRGHGIRWPLQFIYTSNLPVILVSALFANIQLWASLLQNWGYPILGTFDANNNPVSGVVLWLFPPNIVNAWITQGFVDGFLRVLPQAAVYIVALIIGCVIFSWFWVQTSGMDAKSQANNIMKSGLQIPGFRRDARVLERLLTRYISPLTILGAIAVGVLAGIADVSGSLTNGTGLLLAVMIIYRLYEEISKQHMMDLNPTLRNFMGG